MLKAAIIYLPGSGGNFLRRVLSMSQDCIVNDAYTQFNVQQKFALFNKWNSKNWKAAESLYRPIYRTGGQEFYHFEQSNLLLIDSWHPTEFLTHDQQQICWSTGSWPYLIFLHIQDSFKEFIEKNQKTKTYKLDWGLEQQEFAVLRNQYDNRAIDINFDDLCDEQKFFYAIEKINTQLSLNLDLELSLQLWKTWYSKSEAAWVK